MWYEQPTPLGQKLAANAQRRRREGYLAALSPDLRPVLSAAPVVTSPSLDALADLWTISPDGIGHRAPRRPHGYLHRRFSWPEKLFAALDEYGTGRDVHAAYFRPGSEHPAYEVAFGWARRHLRQLVDDRLSGVALSTLDFKGGIVIDSYCGYLQDDFNPSEVVYELACWST